MDGTLSTAAAVRKCHIQTGEEMLNKRLAPRSPVETSGANGERFRKAKFAAANKKLIIKHGRDLLQNLHIVIRACK